MSEPRIPIPREELAAICRKWKVRKLSLFGSVLRDDFRPDSDVDVLVEYEPDAHTTLFDLAGLQFDLEDLFGRDVDVMTIGFVGPAIRNEVLATAVLQYAA